MGYFQIRVEARIEPVPVGIIEREVATVKESRLHQIFSINLVNLAF
jgi:hypothetical protein